MSSDKGRSLPKFGEWDVNNPASSEGFTVIFNKARDEKKTGVNTNGSAPPKGKDVAVDNLKPASGVPCEYPSKSKKRYCCV